MKVVSDRRQQGMQRVHHVQMWPRMGPMVPRRGFRRALTGSIVRVGRSSSNSGLRGHARRGRCLLSNFNRSCLLMCFLRRVCSGRVTCSLADERNVMREVSMDATNWMIGND